MLESTTKYAIKALCYLAKANSDRFIQVNKLSKEIQVPSAYLSKIMKTLSIKGVVTTRKGINGGVKITQRIKDLSFYDVCIALNDPIVHPTCLFHSTPCNKTRPCQLHDNWIAMRDGIAAHLSLLKLNC